MTRRLGRTAVFALAALASCYLGLLLAHLIWDTPHLLVAAFTDAEVVAVGRLGPFRAVPYLYVLQPSEAPLLAFAGFSLGGMLLAPLLLAACIRLAAVSSGWLRLTLVFLAFATAMLTAGAVIGFAGWGFGPLAGLASILGGAGIAMRWILAASVLLACWYCLTRLLQTLADAAEPARRGLTLALWFLLPIMALTAALSAGAWRPGPLQRVVGSFAPLLVALPPFLAAIRPRANWAVPFQPALRGAALVSIAGAFCAAAIAAYPAVARYFSRPQLDDVTSRHWDLSFEHAAFSAAAKQAWADAADQRLEEYSRRLGIPLNGKRLPSAVFLSTKAKRALTHEVRDDRPFTINTDPPALNHLLTPEGKLADPRAEPLLLMAGAWGSPASQSLAEAIARYASGNFLNNALAGYARRIACEERPYTLAEILEINPRYLSPLVRDALSGAWVESLVEDHGIEALPKLYRAIPAQEGSETISGVLNASWNELESAWQSYLLPTDASCDAVTASKRAGQATPRANRSADEPAGVHNGISFSHEVGGDWGYGSESAQRELEKIRGLGANSVAIVPYAFTRAPEETSIRVRTDETDARVIRVNQQARRAGLRVMLKPHLWGRGFTGDLKFTSDGDFEVWWESYRGWLLHFARMAELYNVELLALGNELGGLTVREQPWRELIRDVRRIYSGELTYASHWSGEFERIPFWDQLDYIGVNAYFPLAEPGETPASDSPRVAAIRARLAALAARLQKPLLFTEVGYSSMEGAAIEPWAEREGAVDLDIQAKCYEVVFESAREPWFAGTYWWKWPSHGRGGPYDLSHRPNGKPAMEVLRNGFKSDSTTRLANPVY